VTTFWFVAIAALWTGFLVLEGFDFGVGALHTVIARTDNGRRDVLATIAPVWDGNEVWLVTAGAGMFAAFPGWYATMFSGFYLALVLLLVALILRGVAIEFRGKRADPGWRRLWSIALTVGSLLVPLLIGVALADLVHGLPIDAQQEFVGSFASLFSAYSVLAGVTFLALALFHGAVFLTVKTAGELHARASTFARGLGPPTAALVLAMVIWTHALASRGFLLSLVELAAIVAAIAAVWLVAAGRAGWAFVASTITIAGAVLTLFTNLYPAVMVSSLGAANNLTITITNTSSSPYALRVMTVVVAILLPVVLVYQAWTYHVFRRRLATTFPADTPTRPGRT
jgi:cytochrome bd-type quinol oxidase subunit 2